MFGYVTSFDTEKNVQRTWMIILEYFTCDVSNDTSKYLSTYMNILIRRIFGVSRIFGISFQLQRHQLPVDTIEVYIPYLQICIHWYERLVSIDVPFELDVFVHPNSPSLVSTNTMSNVLTITLSIVLAFTLVIDSASARPSSSTTLNRLTIKGKFVLLVLRVYRGGLFRHFEWIHVVHCLRRRLTFAGLLLIAPRLDLHRRRRWIDWR